MTLCPLLALALTSTNTSTSTAAPPPPPPHQASSFDPFGAKGLRFATEDGAYSIKFGLLLQPWWTYVAAEGDDTNTFRIRRTEFGASGTFFATDVKYKFKAGFDLPNRAGGVSVRLLDAALDWQIIEEIGFQLGQFKVEYSYEALTTTGNNLLIDRSLADNIFGLDRDIGITMHGALFEGTLEYAVYLMNGDGLNNFNRNLTVFGGVRVVMNILGKVALAQSDVGDSQSPNLALGVAWIYDRRNAALASRLVRVTADAAFLYRGIAVLLLGHAVLDTTNDVQDFGVVGQVGYFLWPKHLEVALRGTGIFRGEPSALGGEGDTFEGAFGLNYYFFGHALKLDADYAAIITELEDDSETLDHQIRVMAQLLF